MTDEVFVQYVVRGSSDQTEGRGGYIDREAFVKLEDAIACVKSGRWGVQGVKGDGEVVERKWRVLDGIRWRADDVKIWGYRKDKDQKWRHGFMDLSDSDSTTLDPEYIKYLELKEKFDRDS